CVRDGGRYYYGLDSW
nr:immunoglobulin heavy chain junction region [Macaca mulatta]